MEKVAIIKDSLRDSQNKATAWVRRRELFSHINNHSMDDSEDEETLDNIPEDFDNQLSVGFEAFCAI